MAEATAGETTRALLALWERGAEADAEARRLQAECAAARRALRSRVSAHRAERERCRVSLERRRTA